MTLDEAIKHCLEVAEENETKAQQIGVQFLGTTKDREATECRECAAEHRQLAEWLMEYKDLKAEQNDQYVFINDLMRELRERKATVKRGHWEVIEDYDGDVHYRCTNCKTEFYLEAGNPEDNEYFFCPHCGADIGENEGE